MGRRCSRRARPGPCRRSPRTASFTSIPVKLRSCAAPRSAHIFNFSSEYAGHDLGVQASGPFDSGKTSAAGRAKDKEGAPAADGRDLPARAERCRKRWEWTRPLRLRRCRRAKERPGARARSPLPGIHYSRYRLNPLANGKSLHPRPKPGDASVKLTTRREWQLRFRLILAAHDQGIEEIERDRRNADSQPARPGSEAGRSPTSSASGPSEACIE